MFNKFDMVGLNNFASTSVKKAVGLGVQEVADEYTFIRLSKDLGIVLVLNEYKGTASNLVKVGEVWFLPKPSLIWGLA